MSTSSSNLDQPISEAVALRSAFAREGITTANANRFLSARERGLDWELATEAVAEGLAARALALM